VPLGILGSLVICAVLYMAVSLVVTGMVHYGDLNTAAPLAKAFDLAGQGWAANLISLGAVCGITSVILVLLLGQSRVSFAMARDGLLPPVLAKVHPRFGTPWVMSAITGVVVMVLAAFVPLSELSELTSIGTLFAFVVVSIGVVVLRRTHPHLPRSFRAPLVPWLPALSVLASFWLMLNLPVITWVRFLVWMAAGLVLYFVYGMRRAVLDDEPSESSA
jgi:APA family basic amino acid/polyamine antiporter